MKIVIAIHHFPPHYVSGAEKVTFRIAKGLQNRGHSVRVVCVEDIVGGPEGGLSYTDTEYEGLPVRRLSFRLASAPDLWQWSYNNPWIGEHIRAYLADLKPDIFFLVSGYLMTASVVHAAKDLGIHTVLYLTDYWFLCPRITMLRSNGIISTLPIESTTCARCLGEEKRRFQLLRKMFPMGMNLFWRGQTEASLRIEQRSEYLRDALAKVDSVIAPSQFLGSMYEKSGFISVPIVFIREGLDRISDRSNWNHSQQGQTLRIGYIGQIASHKGVHLIVDAVRSMKTAKIKLTIYGDETAFPAYTKMLRQKINGDERIILAGVFQGADRLKEIMTGFDVTVVPSIWYENSPNAILEALSYGVPVITSDLGGMAELIQNERNGLLFKLGDVSDLSMKLQKLLDNPSMVSELRGNIQPVRTIREQVDEVESLFAKICAQTPSRAGIDR